MRALGPAVVLPFAIFWSTIDRALALPLVPTIAADFDHASLALTGWAITGHALAYAVLQLLWGPLQTKWGRVRVLWVSTSLAAVAGFASALAPDLLTFVIARVASGGAYAATFAAVLVYLGDTLPPARRPAAMSNLATATALGLAAGTLGAGALAEVVGWRWIFGGFAVVSAVLAVLLARQVEPPRAGEERIVPQLRHLVRNRVALGLYGFTILEGTLLIGVYNFVPQALQQTGEGAFVSGLVTAAFGVAVVVVSQSMKLVVRRVRPWVFMLVGGCFAVSAFAVLLTGVSPGTVLAAAAMMGVAWALSHTTLQNWMTDAATHARALGMTFFSISLMLGGALGGALGQLAVDSHGFPALFLGSLGGSVVFLLAGAIGRARYRPIEVVAAS
ncbi:MAG: MFS transporter [Microbacteriaceae bacterium]|nr:MFS transporter [Microbacteriaceae bacterium]